MRRGARTRRLVIAPPCALADKDELGTFGSAQVRDQLKTLHPDKQYDIPHFSSLNEFSADDGHRGRILTKTDGPVIAVTGSTTHSFRRTSSCKHMRARRSRPRHWCSTIGAWRYTVFPGPQPFIGATRLAGTPIAPADAHVRLVELGHEHASVAYMGEDWADHLGPRRPM